MNRSFLMACLISVSLTLWPGCVAAKKKGCGMCKTPCKKPCGGTAKPAAKSADKKPGHTTSQSMTDFGGPMKVAEGESTCVGEVLANPAAYDGKYVRLVGKVHSVCKKRGCWLKLAAKSGNETLFVKFTCPVDGRLIPMEAVGKKAWVEGTLRVKQIPEAEARHYKEDAGASPQELAKIVGPQKTVMMASPAARIAGL